MAQKNEQPDSSNKLFLLTLGKECSIQQNYECQNHFQRDHNHVTTERYQNSKSLAIVIELKGEKFPNCHMMLLLFSGMLSTQNIKFPFDMIIHPKKITPIKVNNIINSLIPQHCIQIHNLILQLVYICKQYPDYHMQQVL